MRVEHQISRDGVDKNLACACRDGHHWFALPRMRVEHRISRGGVDKNLACACRDGHHWFALPRMRVEHPLTRDVWADNFDKNHSAGSLIARQKPHQVFDPNPPKSFSFPCRPLLSSYR